MRIGKITLGLESIDFQDTMFFKDLTLAIEGIRKLPLKDFEEGDATDPDTPQGRLSAIINHHTGLNAQLFVGFEGPSMYLQSVDRNHPLVRDIDIVDSNSVAGLQAVRKAQGQVKGTVNIKTAKVSGVFSEFPVAIVMPLPVLSDRIGSLGDFSAEETAAFILHEVGHAFVYFEFISRTVRTNQVLAALSRELDKTDTQKEREMILVDAKQMLRIKELDTGELATFTDKKVITTIMLANAMKVIKSELGSNIYDEVSWEYLSDQFAARHGAGRALATAMSKLYKNGVTGRGTATYLLFEALKLHWLVATGTLFAAGMPGVGLAASIFFVMWSLGEIPEGPEYDRPHVRIRRMRNQLVEQQKDRALNKDQVKALKADVEILDDVLKNQIHDREQFVTLIGRYVFGIGRQRMRAEQLQQELEALAANDLFGRAGELKHLSKES